LLRPLIHEFAANEPSEVLSADGVPQGFVAIGGQLFVGLIDGLAQALDDVKFIKHVSGLGDMGSSGRVIRGMEISSKGLDFFTSTPADPPKELIQALLTSPFGDKNDLLQIRVGYDRDVRMPLLEAFLIDRNMEGIGFGHLQELALEHEKIDSIHSVVVEIKETTHIGHRDLLGKEQIDHPVLESFC